MRRRDRLRGRAAEAGQAACASASGRSCRRARSAPRPRPRSPEQPERTHAALARLRPPGGPFVLRLNRFFWSDGEAGFRRYLGARRPLHQPRLPRRAAGALPPERRPGGRHRRVDAPRARGGAPLRAEPAGGRAPDRQRGEPHVLGRLLRRRLRRGARGARAGRDRGEGRGAAGAASTRLEIGFNWAYRIDPASEESFWRSLRDRGGAAFVRALDWIGLDAYPGTVFPPAESDREGYRDGMVNGMSTPALLRARCPASPSRCR